MAPKPFPLPLGIGVDIVRVARVIKLLKDEDTINHWSRKIFSRLEWAHLVERFSVAQRNPKHGHSPHDKPRLVLPYVWEKENPNIPPNVFSLGLFLAGRWAAKEAAIKAHRNRKLHYREISIHKVVSDAIPLAPPEASLKPEAFIDPPSRRIRMTRDIAIIRGLKEVNILAVNSVRSVSLDRVSSIRAQTFERRARVREDERQIAEISISHDGDYAIAVCMALDEAPKDMEEDTEFIDDDGSGEPIHEPVWGDVGFLDGKK